MSQQLSDSNRQGLLLCCGAGACFLAGWSAHAAFSSRRRPATAHPDVASSSGKRQAPHAMPAHLSGGETASHTPSAASTPRGSYQASVTDQNGPKMALLVRADMQIVSEQTPIVRACSIG